MATTFPTLPGADPVPFPASVTLELSGGADVNDASKKAGMSFAKLIETTGMAVAESQRLLNKTGADSTTALAGQQVDVIAAQINAYDDDGNLDAVGSRTIPMKLPLINFIDPVFYEWAQVRLQGQFVATEFVGSTETSTLAASASASASQTGLGFFLGAGRNRFSTRVAGSSSDVDTSRESSFGNIRASSLLVPKTDIGVPKPRQLVNAPSLALQIGADSVDPADANVKLKSVLVSCYKKTGEPNANKTLPVSVEVSGAQWALQNPGAGFLTDANGQVELVLRRPLPTPAGATVPDPTPVDVTVSLRLGMVSSTSVVRF